MFVAIEKLLNMFWNFLNILYKVHVLEFVSFSESRSSLLKVHIHKLRHNITALLNIISTTDVTMKNKDMKTFVEGNKLGGPRVKGWKKVIP